MLGNLLSLFWVLLECQHKKFNQVSLMFGIAFVEWLDHLALEHVEVSQLFLSHISEI